MVFLTEMKQVDNSITSANRIRNDLLSCGNLAVVRLFFTR